MLSNPRTRACLLLAALVSSCQGRPQSRDDPALDLSPSATGPDGVATEALVVRTAHYEMRVSAFRECGVQSPESPENGSQRVGVEVSLTRLGELQVPANPYYARLVDRNGNVYEATLGGCGTPLSPSLPAPRQVARGWINFELPRDAREVELTYTPELLGSPKQEVSFQLRL